jgi:hypothetical protein
MTTFSGATGLRRNTVTDRMLNGITAAAATMRKHREREAAARDDLRMIVKAAVDAGVPVSRITRAAGWTQRASVYNLLREGR